MRHTGTKKLSRIERPSHRVTGNRADASRAAGWDVAHVAINDHSRAGFMQMPADEKKTSAADFLKSAVAHYAALGVRTFGVRIQRVPTTTAAPTTPASSSVPARS